MYAIFLFVLGAIGDIIECKYEYSRSNRRKLSKTHDVWYACFMGVGCFTGLVYLNYFWLN